MPKGVFGVLPLHAPTLSTLKPGFVQVYKGGQVAESFFVTGGFAEVTPSSCTVLVDEAIPQATLTRDYAAQRLAAAKTRLDQAANDDDRRRPAGRRCQRRSDGPGPARIHAALKLPDVTVFLRAWYRSI